MTVTITNRKKLSEYTFSDLKDFFYDLSRKISSKVILIEIGNEFFNIALAKSKNGKLQIKKIYRQKLPKEAMDKSLPTDPVAFGSTILGVLRELKLTAQRVAICIPSDTCYTRLIEIPDNIGEKDSYNFLENPDSGIQIPISLKNSDFDISLTSLPKTFINDKTFDRYFLTSIPQKTINLFLETIKSANLELCSIQMSHNCTSNLLKNEIDNLDNEKLIISVELLDEFSQLIIIDKSGPIHLKRLGSIRNYPSIEEMKKINIQDNDPKNSKKTSGYLPLSNLDLKVLIREIKNSFQNFIEENNLTKKGVLFLSGRNSQHINLIDILGESLCMDTFLISPPSNYWVEEFTYNPDEINQFSTSRLIGLGLTLIKDLDFKSYIENSDFIFQKFIKINDDKNSEENKFSKKDLPNLNIKEKKDASKLKIKDKESELKNKKIQKKVESKLKIKEKEVVTNKLEELPPLPNLNIQNKKDESKLNIKEKESELKNKKIQNNNKNFKMDTSFLNDD